MVESGNQGSSTKLQIVYFLRKSAQNLKWLESYFEGRHRKIHSSYLVKESISEILKLEPQVIFIASDHPNKKVQQLPGLLNKAVGVPVVGYCEQTGPAAMAALEGLGLRYLLYPPISGRAIERVLQRIERDVSEEAATSHTEATKKKWLEEQKIEIQNFSEDIPDDTNSIDEAPGAEAEPNHSSSGEDIGQDVRIYRGQRQELATAEVHKGEKLKNNFIHQKGHHKLNGVIVQKGTPVEAGDADGLDPADTTRAKGPGFLMAKGSAAKGELHHIKGSRKKGLGPRDEAESEAQKKGIFHLRGTAAKKNKHVGGGVDSEDEINQVTGNPNEQTELVGSTRELACLTLKSKTFSGYLVAAAAKPLSEADFFLKVKQKIQEFLSGLGEDLTEAGDILDLEVDEVSFQSWATEQAAFLRRAAHSGAEIALAFFPAELDGTELTSDAPMAKLSMAEISGDQQVAFDVYLYLPGNNRYILYTPEGKVLFADQKDRLQKKGINDLHIKKEALPQLKKMRVQSFLNASIGAFKKKSNDKKKQVS